MADLKVCLKVIDPFNKRSHVGVIFFKIAICFVVVASFLCKIFTNKKLANQGHRCTEPAHYPEKSILKYTLHVNPQYLAFLECTNALVILQTTFIKITAYVVYLKNVTTDSVFEGE